MELKFFKVTEGLAWEVCNKHMRVIDAAMAQVMALAKESGAWVIKEGEVIQGTKAKRDYPPYVRLGNTVEGLHFKVDPGKDWKRIKGVVGGYKPNGRTKAGQEWKRKLGLIHLPIGEDLAVALGFEPFFYQDGGQWCSQATIVEIEKVFFISLPVNVRGKNLPMTSMTRGEFYTVTDAAK